MRHLGCLLVLQAAAAELARSAALLRRANDGYIETLSEDTIGLVKQRLAETARGRYVDHTSGRCESVLTCTRSQLGERHARAGIARI